MKRARACIVTTVGNPGPSYESWIRYHLSLGFEKIFVFFDTPADPMFKVLKKIKGVEPFLRNKALLKKYKLLRVYPFQKKIISEDVMARQILNANLAMKLALQQNLDWMFHIDADEMVSNKLACPIGDVLSQVPEDVEQIRLLNHEGVPESIGVVDPFIETTLFKRNLRLMENFNKRKSKVHGKYFSSIKHPKERLYFIGYQHGKSCARVRSDIFPGVHDFVKETKNVPVNVYSGEEENTLKTIEVGEIVIYHYQNCSFIQYLTKYRLLKDFTNKFKHNHFREKSLHILSRDAFRAGDFYRMWELYNNRVLFTDKMGKKELLKAGIFFEDKSISKRISKLLKKSSKKK